MFIPYQTILHIKGEFSKKIASYSVKEYKIDSFSFIYVLNDSLVLLLEILEDDSPIPININENELYRSSEYLELVSDKRKYYKFYIEELTYNEIGFKHNHSKFLRTLEKELNIMYLSLNIFYTRFRGYTRVYWDKESEMPIEYFDRKLPELELKKRYNQWPGVKYNFILIELEGKDGTKTAIVAYTTINSHKYMRSFCNRIIKQKRYVWKDFVRGNQNGFTKSLISWKNIRLKKRLEEKLTYSIIEEFHRESSNVWKRADELLELYDEGKFTKLQKFKFEETENRWKSEELVFNLTKKLFKDYHVIYQHRPYFLKSKKGGQLSYDVFISNINVAIEYQGKQHFEPVDFFGGKESFEDTKRRDKEKLKISVANGVNLIYVNYWEEISDELIKNRVNLVTPDEHQ